MNTFVASTYMTCLFDNKAADLPVAAISGMAASRRPCYIATANVVALRWLQWAGHGWLHRLIREPGRWFKIHVTHSVAFGLKNFKQWWLKRGVKRATTTAPPLPPPVQTPDTRPASIADLLCPERLDAAEVSVIEQAWVNRLEGPAEGVIIDCAGTQFIDSSGLGLLVRMQKRCRVSGRHLILAALSPAVLKLLQMTRLNSIFTQATSHEEALNKILNAYPRAAPSSTLSTPLQLNWSSAVTTSSLEGLWCGAQLVIQHAADAHNTVVIDLHEVLVMDSDGLNLMARLKDHAGSRHIYLRFANASPVVHETLHHEHMEHLLSS